MASEDTDHLHRSLTHSFRSEMEHPMTSSSTSRRTLLKTSLAGAAAATLAAPAAARAQTPEPAQGATPTTGAQTRPDLARSETTVQVFPAVSQRNLFAGVTLPQHPFMADSNWNSAHQDSYCTDSVGLSGPSGSTLRVIKQPNPFGFTPTMACNAANQMIGIAINLFAASEERKYELVVFDQDLNILAHHSTGSYSAGSFGGGYFYLNSDDNAVVIDNDNNAIACYPTANVAAGDALDPLWASGNLVELITGSPTGNSVYGAVPDWSDPTLYWVLLSGGYELAGHLVSISSPAHMAIVRITPDTNQPNGTVTELLHALPFESQWNNNTFAVDDGGCYMVTNGVTSEGVSDSGALYALAFNPATGQIETRWSYAYQNSGLLKPGHTNIGSGTTPTLMVDADGRKLVAITDNANPYLNLVVLEAETGQLVSETPIFPMMRGACEASVIGVNNRIVVPNNFGHTAPRLPQTVSNEPGLTMVEIPGAASGTASEVVWEDTRTVTIGMNMLCRESGIIFAHTGEWNDAISAIEGGMYYLSAIDSWDGRVIWRIPIGLGRANIKDFGGQYFDRDGNVYLGVGAFLVSIQNVEA